MNLIQALKITEIMRNHTVVEIIDFTASKALRSLPALAKIVIFENGSGMIVYDNGTTSEPMPAREGWWQDFVAKSRRLQEAQ